MLSMATLSTTTPSSSDSATESGGAGAGAEEIYNPLVGSERPKMFVDYLNGPLKGRTDKKKHIFGIYIDSDLGRCRRFSDNIPEPSERVPKERKSIEPYLLLLLLPSE